MSKHAWKQKSKFCLILSLARHVGEKKRRKCCVSKINLVVSTYFKNAVSNKKSLGTATSTTTAISRAAAASADASAVL